MTDPLYVPDLRHPVSNDISNDTWWSQGFLAHTTPVVLRDRPQKRHFALSRRLPSPPAPAAPPAAVKLLRFFPVPQTHLLYFSTLVVKDRDLLNPG